MSLTFRGTFSLQLQVDVKPEQQNPIVEATKRGRGGKTVTVIKGLQHQQESLTALCKSLKVKIGSGGAVKDGEIEIQVCFQLRCSSHTVGMRVLDWDDFEPKWLA